MEIPMIRQHVHAPYSCTMCTGKLATHIHCPSHELSVCTAAILARGHPLELIVLSASFLILHVRVYLTEVGPHLQGAFRPGGERPGYEAMQLACTCQEIQARR